MTVNEFLHARGLTSIEDEIHKHPSSGSDWSIRSLIEDYQRISLPDKFNEFINSSSDACSLEASLAEQTEKEWRHYTSALNESAVS